VEHHGNNPILKSKKENRLRSPAFPVRRSLVVQSTKISLQFHNSLSLLHSLLQKPDLLTTFSRSDGINNTNLNINDLTPAREGQDIPAKGGQGHRLFHLPNIIEM
jgi:hypothetical protein